jgi:SAM-dependent methyltransferase
MPLIDLLFSIGSIRKAIWQRWYPFLTQRLHTENVIFLNYAFETDPPMAIPLSPDDERDRACVQLYHHVGTLVDLKGKQVLEVSCGHGGGASYLARTQDPSNYTALDLNYVGIDFCTKTHLNAECHLDFIPGDAQNLPFLPKVFDVILNVEASHCYPDFSAFLAEVHRVLRPGGYFLYADFRFKDGISAWEKALDATPLNQIQMRDISREVLRGMDCNSDRSNALLAGKLPDWLQGLARDFAGVKGSRIYLALQSGELSYRSYLFQKPPLQEP